MSPSDSDYVRSDQSANQDDYVIGLGAVPDPGVNTGFAVRLREMKDAAAGDTIDLDVTVQAAGWDVRTESYDDIDETINAVNFTLSTYEVNEFRAHGGFADMRVRLRKRTRASITTNIGVTYTTSPSTLICDIRRPSSGGPFPVIIMVVDAGWDNNNYGVGGPAAASAIRLAEEEGFATICLELRVVPGAIAPAPMEDCADLVAFIIADAATYNLDPTKIAAVGGSGGGHVGMFLAFGTYLTVDQFARFKCYVSGSSPTDLPALGDDLPGADPTIEAFMGVSEAAGLATWQFFSPTFRVAADTKPILHAHSTSELIPLIQATRLETVLAASGIEYRMLTYTGTSHGWALIDDAAPWAEMVTWLHRYLG